MPRFQRARKNYIRAASIACVFISGIAAVMTFSALPAAAATRTFSGIGVTADGAGYGLISRAGEVYAFGSTLYHGNPAGFSGSIVGISVTSDGQGYAAISSTGQVYAYGTVAYHGNPAGFSGSIVGISVTSNGQGYAASSSIGQVYAYGTVKYWGNGDPGSDSTGSLQSRIASIGNAEYQNAGHNHESPAGSNCNYYTAALGAGSACSGGWRSEEWCADFARWVWGQAGAVTTGLSGAAISFEKSHGGWHSGNLSGIQVGDVIGWNFGGSPSDDHVSVVVGINANGSLNLLDGNWGNAIGARTIAGNTTSLTANGVNYTVSGYAIAA